MTKQKKTLKDYKVLFHKLWSERYPTIPLRSEYTFDRRSPRRMWRFDAASPEHMLAVEIDGGTHMVRAGKNGMMVGGQHNSAEDREKLNQAAAQGWRVLHFTPRDLSKTPDMVADLVYAAMCHAPQS